MQRNIIFFLLSLLLLMSCSLDDEIVDEATKSIVINEFMASNDGAVVDPDEDDNDGDPYEDWFELYNAGTSAVDVGGMYVTDKLEEPTKYQIPTTNSALTTIEPGGFLVIWADKETQQGENHVDFSLSGSGEAIGLIDEDGVTFIAELSYSTQQTDYSYGRVSDGGDEWQVFSTATPGASNSGGSSNLAPYISDLSVLPDSITASSEVTVSAVVTDDNLQSVTVYYGLQDAITNSAAMSTSDSVYKANIGTFDDGNRIFFYVQATDDESVTSISDTLSFEVGYVAPVLYINEFMASNDAANIDEYGEFEDWVEIYNPGTEPIDIGGMYITDKLDELTEYQIPDTYPDSTTIPAGGFLLLYCDKQTEQGVLHVNIKLSGSGEQIGLTAPNGITVIDSLTYDTETEGAFGYGLQTDQSYGRQPDGSDTWVIYTDYTPGSSNN